MPRQAWAAQSKHLPWIALRCDRGAGPAIGPGLAARHPADPLLCYVVDLVDRYTVSTIDRRLSSIGYYHKQARHGLPTKDPEVERTMRGTRRAKGIAPNGKAPILTPLLRHMVAALPDDVSGLPDK